MHIYYPHWVFLAGYGWFEGKILYFNTQIRDQYLTEPCKESFLISPCTKNEILEIISSLDYYKAVGINSIPIKILKLAKEQIAEHLYFIYIYINLSFTTGIFPDSLKLLKLHQFTKRVPNLSALTIDL